LAHLTPWIHLHIFMCCSVQAVRPLLTALMDLGAAAKLAGDLEADRERLRRQKRQAKKGGTALI